MDAETAQLIKGNLFAGAHASIADWDKFPWHRDRNGQIQTHKIESSQALAIDVFGTIKASQDRCRILGELSERCGLSGDGPWDVELEWTDPSNLLREPRPTQIDAIAFGKSSVLVFECKFTEAGGPCSQIQRIRSGRGQGFPQCNGDYATQTNPLNGLQANCALTAKGVRYWEIIPRIYGLSATEEHRSCPFKADSYQWMRNVVLAYELASARECNSRVIAAYADGRSLPTARKVAAGGLGYPVLAGQWPIMPMSYQSILELALSVGKDKEVWQALSHWVDRKIQSVDGQMRL